MKSTRTFEIIAVTLILLSIFTFYIPHEKKAPLPTGEVPVGVFVYSAIPLDCNMTFEEGWNLVSFPCFSEPELMQTFETGLEKNISSFHWYNPVDDADHWKAYNPILPSWVIQDINQIYKENGYWVKSPSIVKFDYDGEKASVSRIDIKQGWNLIGYPTNNSRLINESISFMYSSVHMYNTSDTSDYWKVHYNPPVAQNDLEYFFVYYGYWVNSDENTSWIINW